MKVLMRATVLDGGLELDEPVGFPDHYRVQVSVEPLPAAEQEWQAAFQAFQELSPSVRSTRAEHASAVRNCMNAVDTNVVVYSLGPACLAAGVDTLYSEDLDPGTTYETVTVVNPFL